MNYLDGDWRDKSIDVLGKGIIGVHLKMGLHPGPEGHVFRTPKVPRSFSEEDAANPLLEKISCHKTLLTNLG